MNGQPNEQDYDYGQLFGQQFKQKIEQLEVNQNQNQNEIDMRNQDNNNQYYQQDENQNRKTRDEIINNLKTDTNFYLSINGLIQKCKIDFQDNLTVKFKIVYGELSNGMNGQNQINNLNSNSNNSWQLVDGNELGISQRAIINDSIENEFVWNLPFELVLKSEQVKGWPQIVIVIYGYDYFGRSKVVGYGVGNVPTKQGIHQRTIYLFKLKKEYRLFSWLLSFVKTKEEFTNPERILAHNQNRECLKTEHIGHLDIQYRIQLDNHRNHDLQ